jgi:probable rRNA maturation factor
MKSLKMGRANHDQFDRVVTASHLAFKMGIELTNNSSVKSNEDEIKSVAAFALGKMGIHPDSDLSITLVDEEEMENLHIEWMDLPGPTDVLSFPMDELKPFSASKGPGIIGDIVLCPTFAAKQAKSTVAAELALLTIHGVLHLLGFDHAEKEEEKEMFELQEKILKEWQSA